jgi:hypothetical protein
MYNIVVACYGCFDLPIDFTFLLHVHKIFFMHGGLKCRSHAIMVIRRSLCSLKWGGDETKSLPLKCTISYAEAHVVLNVR